MTEDRDIAERPTSTVKPVRAETGNVEAVYRYQCEPVSGLIADATPGEAASTTPLNLLAETCWATN